MEIEHRKKLNSEVEYIILDENDLYRLGKIILDVAQKYSQSVRISIETSNGEDTLSANNPSIFLSPEMPRQIRSVRYYAIYASNFNFRNPDFECFLTLTAYPPSGSARVEVNGINSNEITGLYYNIVKELQSKQSRFKWLLNLTDNIGFTVAIHLLSAASTFYIFDIPLDLLSANVAEFHMSTLHIILQTIGLFCIIYMLTAGADKINNFFKAFAAKVHFGGRLSDPNTVNRIGIAWVIGFILIPIFVNIVSNYIWAM